MYPSNWSLCEKSCKLGSEAREFASNISSKTSTRNIACCLIISQLHKLLVAYKAWHSISDSSVYIECKPLYNHDASYPQHLIEIRTLQGDDADLRSCKLAIFKLILCVLIYLILHPIIWDFRAIFMLLVLITSSFIFLLSALLFFLTTSLVFKVAFIIDLNKFWFSVKTAWCLPEERNEMDIYKYGARWYRRSSWCLKTTMTTALHKQISMLQTDLLVNCPESTWLHKKDEKSECWCELLFARELQSI